MRRYRSTVTGMTAIALTALALAGTAQAEFSAASVYRHASPSVVVVFSWDAKGNSSAGTGSLVSRDGMILTNNHVIFDPKTKKPYVNIRVYFKPDRITGDPKSDLTNPHSIRVVARDEALDLALLPVRDAPSSVPVMPMGDSESIDIGSSVAAIGHPTGGGLWTLTTGTVSSRRREGKRDVFQTDAAINPGNSGGPLLDGNAHLIGVNTFVRRVSRDGLPLDGLAYSLRSSLVRGWLSNNGVQVAYAAPMDHASVPASTPTPAPQTTPAPEPAPEPTKPPAAEPEPSLDIPHGSMKPAPSKPTPPAEAPRTFKGPNGEEMYGVPQRDFSLMGASAEIYEQAFKNANKAFDALDEEF